LLGSSVSAPAPLSIRQRGQPDLDFRLWNGKRGWLLDFTHHKLYLTNRPPEFLITNGMNRLTLGRGFRRGRLTYAHVHLGLGYQAERTAPERRHAAP